MSVCGCYQITTMVARNEISNNHLSCGIEDVIIRIDHHFAVYISEEAPDHEVVVEIILSEVMIRWVVYSTELSVTLAALVERVNCLSTGQDRFSFYIIKCRFHPTSLLRNRINVNYVLTVRLELTTTGV